MNYWGLDMEEYKKKMEENKTMIAKLKSKKKKLRGKIEEIQKNIMELEDENVPIVYTHVKKERPAIFEPLTESSDF